MHSFGNKLSSFPRESPCKRCTRSVPLGYSVLYRCKKDVFGHYLHFLLRIPPSLSANVQEAEQLYVVLRRDGRQENKMALVGECLLD